MCCVKVTMENVAVSESDKNVRYFQLKYYQILKQGRGLRLAWISLCPVLKDGNVVVLK